jgi:heme-degrading monooxygenase HmoA
MLNVSHVIVFRSRLRPGIEAEYHARAEQLYSIVSAMPGLLCAKDFVADDGERVSIIEFDSEEHLAAWRDHPEHIRAQQEGRERFYASYSIQVCRPERVATFDA